MTTMNKTKTQTNVPAMLTVFCAVYIAMVKLRPLVMPNVSISVVSLCIAYCLLGAAGIYLFRSRYIEGLKQWKEHTLRSILWFVGGYIADVILVSLSLLPQMTLYPDYDGMNDNSITAAAKYLPAFLMILALGILGPVTEETFFRFILVDKLKAKVPAVLCVLISSVLFMVWHMHAFTPQELLANLPKFTSGVIYSIILLRSKNPTIPVLLHTSNNILGLLGLVLNGAA